jgi:hypothetical protein
LNTRSCFKSTYPRSASGARRPTAALTPPIPWLVHPRYARVCLVRHSWSQSPSMIDPFASASRFSLRPRLNLLLGTQIGPWSDPRGRTHEARAIVNVHDSLTLCDCAPVTAAGSSPDSRPTVNPHRSTGGVETSSACEIAIFATGGKGHTRQYGRSLHSVAQRKSRRDLPALVF